MSLERDQKPKKWKLRDQLSEREKWGLDRGGGHLEMEKDEGVSDKQGRW